MLPIRHAGTEFYGLEGKPATPEDHWLVLALLHRRARAPFLPSDVHLVAAQSELYRIQTKPRPAGVKTKAYINHGRWLANCPDPTCNGAELIHLDNPAFYCGSCLNAKWNGALVDVEMPNIAPIVALLETRDDRRLQQWQPGWTIEQVQDLHLSFTIPYTWTTGEVATAAKFNTSAGRDNETALDATFDRLLAQMAIAGGVADPGTWTNGNSVSVTVNNAADKIRAEAYLSLTGGNQLGYLNIRDVTQGVNGPIVKADISNTTVSSGPTLATFAEFSGTLILGAHTIQLQWKGTTLFSQVIRAWVIPNNV